MRLNGRPTAHARSGRRWQSGRRGFGCPQFSTLRVGVAKCGPRIAGFTRYRNRASPESLKTQHDSTLPPPPAAANAEHPLAAGPCAGDGTPPAVARASHGDHGEGVRNLGESSHPSLVDALFECYLKWKDASSEVWQAYARWRQALSGDRLYTFLAYSDALATEEHASKGYAELVAAVTDRRDRRAGRGHDLSGEPDWLLSGSSSRELSCERAWDSRVVSVASGTFSARDASRWESPSTSTATNARRKSSSSRRSSSTPRGCPRPARSGRSGVGRLP